MEEYLFKELQANVRSKTIEKAIIEGQIMAGIMDGYIIVRSFDLQNKPMDVEDWLTIPKLVSIASKYVILDISKILRPMINLTDEIAWQAREINLKQERQNCKIPELREFFWFLPKESEYILRKKRWP